MQPVVSIILPTFGRLQYLRPTVVSVYRQTFQNWELIVSDDGSDAETRSYLCTLEADSRVRLLWLTHSGIPAIVRNAALREARGEYIAFLDSDDLWAPDKLITASRSDPAFSTHVRLELHGGFPTSTAPDSPWLSHFSGLGCPCNGAVFERLVTGPVVIRTPSSSLRGNWSRGRAASTRPFAPAKTTIGGYGWHW